MHYSQKSIRIVQSAGLGDIIFIQKLIKFLDKTNTVYHPINTRLYETNAKALIGPKTCGSENDSNILKNVDIIYNCSSFQTSNEDLMTSKYKGSETTHENWQDFVSFKINPESKNIIEKKYSEINWNEPYILVNKNYGFDISCSQMKIHNGVESTASNWEGQRINMDVIPDVTLFDWKHILEKAVEIHTVDTSLCYLIECLDVTDNLNVHTRHPTKFTKALKNIWTRKNWNFIDYSNFSKEEWKKIAPGESF